MSAKDPPGRKPDADRTRRDIMAVARAEFVEHGLSGARVDSIAERTATTKRMIYYYFGSKEGLYSAVLEQAYADIRPPEEALTRLIEAMFDFEDSHPDVVRLIAIENIHQAAYLARLPSIRQVNARAIETLAAIMARGHEAGVFGRDADPVDVHLMISALCFYRVSNQHTFGLIFGRDLQAPDVRAAHRTMIVETIMAYLRG
jgi:AcrR family transcriptional regulator